MDFEKDPYEVLGIVDGPKATDDEIKKAYRKLALAKHPDKNRDNPNAADEFAALQKAYDVLTDKDARAALDGVHAAKAAREEREANQGSKVSLLSSSRAEGSLRGNGSALMYDCLVVTQIYAAAAVLPIMRLIVGASETDGCLTSCCHTADLTPA